MNTWIAFFRGINVGGNNVLPMRGLPALFAKCGCADAQTYIQSGNVVFRSAAISAAQLATRIGEAVLADHGFQPRVLVLGVQELTRAIGANPFPQADAEPKSLHLFFLDAAPNTAGLRRLEEVKTTGESFVLRGRVFYLHTAAGFAGSKVAERVERALGVGATARNWRTCRTVLALATQLG